MPTKNQLALARIHSCLHDCWNPLLLPHDVSYGPDLVLVLQTLPTILLGHGSVLGASRYATGGFPQDQFPD